mmetsp:Transcript_53878/g.81716  ORF Transcript_53878/g.81716 Transcript_53878/m.81716 type:complete len:80 (-) Transcript_53878:270-509(-)
MAIFLYSGIIAGRFIMEKSWENVFPVSRYCFTADNFDVGSLFLACGKNFSFSLVYDFKLFFVCWFEFAFCDFVVKFYEY